jgi:hypothetical protein
MLRNSNDYVHTLNMILAKCGTPTRRIRRWRRMFGKVKETLRLVSEGERCKRKSFAVFIGKPRVKYRHFSAKGRKTHDVRSKLSA